VALVLAPADAGSTESVGSAVMPESVAVPAFVARYALPGARALSIGLPSLTAQERAWVDDPDSISGSLRIGFGRAVPRFPANKALGPWPHWHQTPDGGHAVALTVSSPSAAGLRLALRVRALPDSATLGVFAPGSPEGATLTGAEVNESIRRHRDSGAAHDQADIYWMPLTQGQSVTLRIVLPAGVDPDGIQIALPHVSHLFRWPFAGPDQATGVTGCQVDVACHPELDGLSRATVMLLYTDELGGTGTCTGTLLNDSDPATHIPYVLTAHHCVGDQTRASSIEAVWFHRAHRCGGPGDAVRSVPGGADLLHAARSTDTSLLRLRRPPPAGAVFSAWTTARPELGAAVIGVFQPRGGRQAVAFGRLASFEHCEEAYYCGEDADPDGLHYLRVDWDRGVTEPGTSGSGLFLPSGALVGILSGGFGNCERPRGPDDYGRFDLAYEAALRRWLSPGWH
jgi:hypothetical protein